MTSVFTPTPAEAPDFGRARVAEGRARVKAGLRPPPPAASALTHARPSAVLSAVTSTAGSGLTARTAPSASLETQNQETRNVQKRA
jgi:hypothetical protein